MEPLAFKYKILNEQGQETGFFSTRGEVSDDHLTLGKDSIPLAAIAQVVRRQNRLVVVVVTDDRPLTICLAVNSGSARLVKETIDRLCSTRWAEMRQNELAQTGRKHLFRTAECQHCHATIDLSGFAPSPEVFCPFCEMIGNTDDAASPLGSGFRLCDNCGYFSHPRRFTSFYFVFLLVVYYYSHKTTTRCHACMRAEAWKMLFGNAPFLIGVPFALGQLIRAYFAGSLRSQVPELDAANHAAESGKIEKAERLYQAILDRTLSASGIHYNRARALARVQDWHGSVDAARASLADCANYRPAAELIVAALQEQNLPQQVELFQQQWGQSGLQQAAVID